MTGAQKEDIFNLLKAASSCNLGYTPKAFKTVPSFTDDPALPQTQAKGAAVAEAKSRLSINSIAQKIQACKNCSLAATRHNVVPGEGVENPVVLVVGEGPGEDEDKTGRPFVGKAGQLLDKMLSAIELDRTKNCYIANIVKCRPPANRTPQPEEAEACSGFLQAQIHLLKPKMILAMGRTAFQNLLKTTEGINSARGKFFDLNGIPLMPTYHPSALLRDESLKRPAWEDLKAFKARLLQICPDYNK